MTNLTLQPYSTKLAKHQPTDFRNPTEKGESAGLPTKKQKQKKKGRKQPASNSATLDRRLLSIKNKIK